MPFGDLLGESPTMHRLRAMLARVAATDSTVLVVGESGTGKELVARALHEEGTRRSGPFVAINCAAVPEGLLESELFGHAKGAFTDAKTARAGLFVQASGGTLFLDEVGELPLAFQAKLLRALQERTVRPVGERKEIPFDVRLVAATNRNLQADVAEGRFREDLYFRINVVEVPLPPLRERDHDVLVLATHFLGTFAAKVSKPLRGLTPEAAEWLSAYAWPGNVRELRNTIERAVALAALEQLTTEDLPAKLARKVAAPLPMGGLTELVTLDEMMERYILHVLHASGGSRNVAAKILGVDRTTLWRKLERLRRLRSKGGAR
ncbi:Response regulator of zinc sigma-54-dependent two-component system [Labilithrix luteola]|uniref:Response regulator of zinc sigma-54-dependent two-component system n=1 Tax=Labilithrix luteola TaxID=1391654 RepID=A0A0K1PTH6_9BACT|nr:Response regulator of zinc sigma-54-dependent two-component system [Labilithrix luteola]